MKPDEIIKLVKGCAEVLNGEYAETLNGVPRIIFQGKDYKISVVYVARTNQWKAFYPFPSSKQKRKYFKDIHELSHFLVKECF